MEKLMTPTTNAARRYTFYLPPEVEQAMATVRRLMFPQSPWATKSETVRAALQFTAKALAEKATAAAQAVSASGIG
jgi:hypothetical protein